MADSNATPDRGAHYAHYSLSLTTERSGPFWRLPKVQAWRWAIRFGWRWHSFAVSVSRTELDRG